MNKNFKFVEINTIEVVENECVVNDLTVDYDHSYIANDYVVHNCITSTQTSVHYPMASLIEECNANNYNHVINIVADGGIKNYSDVIKAIGLGADYVMIGGLFAKSFESCGTVYTNADNYEQELQTDIYVDEKTKKDIIKDYTPIREYYGMASKRAQKEFGGKGNKTAEGKDEPVKIEFTLKGWIDNMTAYFRSAMSYTNAFTLNQFRQNTKFVINSTASINAVNK